MSGVPQEVFPLIWSDDVERLLNWSVSSLGLKEAWRAPGEQGLEHAEVLWPGGRVSLNIRTDSTRNMGPNGISLRVDDPTVVDAVPSRFITVRWMLAAALRGREFIVCDHMTTAEPEGPA